jgi:hypothetical protein
MPANTELVLAGANVSKEVALLVRFRGSVVCTRPWLAGEGVARSTTPGR